MALPRFYKSLLKVSIVIGVAFAIGSLVGIALFASQSNAALQYTDKDLVLKDFEQMQSIINKIRHQNLHMDDIDESRKIKSKDALVTLLSRRDSDGSRSKLFRVIQGDLDEEDFITVLDLVVDESILALADSSLSLIQRSTHLMILQNFITETRGQLSSYRGIFEKIRDANLTISSDLVEHRLMKSTAKAENPSELAEKIVGKKKS